VTYRITALEIAGHATLSLLAGIFLGLFGSLMANGWPALAAVGLVAGMAFLAASFALTYLVMVVRGAVADDEIER
jgi:hypothetical protein